MSDTLKVSDTCNINIKQKQMWDDNGVYYYEVIVGNIIGDHYLGENKEVKSGTKHFGAGTKVYCAFMYGGNGHEAVRVLGKPRKSFRMIEIVLHRGYIKYFRLQKCYSPQVIDFMTKYDRTWLENEKPEFVQWLNSMEGKEIQENNQIT